MKSTEKIRVSLFLDRNTVEAADRMMIERGYRSRNEFYSAMIKEMNMDEMLEKLGILEKKNAKIKHLSGGQKQRVAIARALVKKPDIILADEPTGNLNFAIGEEVIKQLCEVSEGKTLIAVTHDDRLAKYFDIVIDMNEVTCGMRDSVDEKEGE